MSLGTGIKRVIINNMFIQILTQEVIPLVDFTPNRHNTTRHSCFTYDPKLLNTFYIFYEAIIEIQLKYNCTIIKLYDSLYVV